MMILKKKKKKGVETERNCRKMIAVGQYMLLWNPLNVEGEGYM